MTFGFEPTKVAQFNDLTQNIRSNKEKRLESLEDISSGKRPVITKNCWNYKGENENCSDSLNPSSARFNIEQVAINQTIQLNFDVNSNDDTMEGMENINEDEGLTNETKNEKIVEPFLSYSQPYHTIYTTSK